MYSRFQNAWPKWQMTNGVTSQQMAILNNRRNVIASSKTNSDVTPFGRSAICHFGQPFWNWLHIQLGCSLTRSEIEYNSLSFSVYKAFWNWSIWLLHLSYWNMHDHDEFNSLCCSPQAWLSFITSPLCIAMYDGLPCMVTVVLASGGGAPTAGQT